ncbi:MAG: GIY-YIG nuclease family protein [Balneolaceae bacterium]
MEIGTTYYVYILTNKRRTVLYTGKTHDLSRRMTEHKQKLLPKSFTARYNIDRLVYFEIYGDTEEAKQREQQIKAGSRQKKIDLINSMNPEWKDLSK